MVRLLLLCAVALALGSCEKAREERRAAFMKRCDAAKFEPAQCVFLLSILNAADDAAGDAAAANAMAAIHASTRP